MSKVASLVTENNMKEILIIGPGSLTGSRFVELGKDKFEMYGAGGGMDENLTGLVSFQSLDITNQKNVEAAVSSFPGTYVMNFAGATLVDEIEKTRPADSTDKKQLDENIAYKVNVLGTKFLADACKKYDKFPIFISTGFVFDGKDGPYSEEDQVASLPDDVSWYAWTKILAENEVKKSGVENLTIRISYPYRSEYIGKLDFARNFLKVYDEYKSGIRDSIYPMFADQFLTPTFIDDIPRSVGLLLGKGEAGVFHLSSPEIVTPYDFCLELLRVARNVDNPEELIKKGSIVEFQQSHPEIAKRPVQGGEKSDKIKMLGFTPTSWKEGIRKAFEKKG
ncbi:hypothetical protein A3F00_00075 [Candidatus Daviesbacteria bacterium RIFCSPHIGHO2_12_FULL_37_11]|uniref:dTDP-4-dehydrorhamnose reductase n=1 Tax=Candidatus Daviesbacteria bacterium RIFCSPHIGHO2_12_FULL_37_11 TaxID=1797777 RepID=A0A1F5KAB4_9BACT|nr:MAG: hypothetical protein A3F00_00075 [Candidatus Daviesbacteria bacterium RIFCSPHIGHO2_12_FULL_37_11]OGE44907.1 MAG: hypothetical protein A3B39_02315 [Candidatus Daviesbacteria bacterium RIFCSPLOWO2_01_FULL_37_10]